MPVSSHLLRMGAAVLGVLVFLGLSAGIGLARAESVEHSLEEVYVWTDLGFDNQPDGPRNTVLQCPDGTLAIGLSYNKGSAVDSLTLHCKEPRFAGSYFQTWSADSYYQPVTVGGTGGSPHDLYCPEGMVIAGTHGVNYNWQPDDDQIYATPQWLMASIGIECAKLIQSHPWQVAHFEHGSAGTALARGERTNIFAPEDMDNYNSGGFFIFTSNPRKNGFSHHCIDTPIAGYEIAFGLWKQLMGDWVPVIQAARWHCY